MRTIGSDIDSDGCLAWLATPPLGTSYIIGSEDDNY